MSSFNDAVAQAMESLNGVAGVPITYHRGDEWVALTAVAGSSTFRVDDGGGVVIKERSRDYLFKACELQLNGEAATPVRGDLIKEVVGASLHTYEVLRPDDGEQVYRFSDHGRTTIRVHTKLKAVTANE